jgi:hypothetical protein
MATPVAAAERARGLGYYASLGTVLDDIEHIFEILRKLREVDPSAYAFNAKVGGRILPRDAVDSWAKEDVWHQFLAEMPMQGLVYSRDVVYDDPVADDAPAKGFRAAQYFIKMQKPRAVIDVRPGDVIYHFVSVIAGPNKKHKRRTRIWATGCHVAIRAGDIVVLREAQCEMRNVRRWKQHPQPIFAPTFHCDYPKSLWSWVHCLNSEEWRRARGVVVSPETYVGEMFRDTGNAWVASRDGEFHVRIERDGLAAAFSVPRTVEFFKDRRTALARDGRRKRIFHSVIEHQRLIDGKVVHVPAHYRGERHFDWGGGRVTITAPGQMHLDVLRGGPAAVYEDEIDDDRDDWVPPDELAAIVVSAGERVIANRRR